MVAVPFARWLFFLMVLQAGCYNGCILVRLLRHCKVVTVDFCVVLRGLI